MNRLISLPSDTSLWSLILGLAGIFAVLYIFRQIRRISWFEKSTRDRLNRLQPLLELSGALVVLFWIVWVLFKGQTVYLTIAASVLALGTLWTIRFFFSDLVAGFILRSENLFQAGDSIVIEDQQAIIEGVGVRCLTIAKADGTSIRIPYNRLVNTPMAKPTAHTIAKSHSFEISVTKEADTLKLFDRIKNMALNSVWSISTLSPRIELLKEDDTECRFRVTVYALKNEHFSEIEKNVIRGTGPHSAQSSH